ncbi:MAG TPA: GNAT family N-acetyltransferase [Chloroflexota bacterium]|nr:GNAT family N-acetyltransferase [Chloroflexota bacterium]
MTQEVSLRELTRENWWECASLELPEDQAHFVASNLISIAQSRIEPERTPMAIYVDETMVGFVLFNDRPLWDGSYRLSRLMIDHDHQGRGYGRAATKLVISRLRDVAGCHEILLDYHQDNHAAASLYTSLGFEPFDEHDGVIVCRLRLNA